MLNFRDMGIIIDIKSELPFGAGLGSSASLNVSLATAFLLLCQFIVPQCQEEADGASNCQFSNDDLQLINSWAFQGELIAHGKPSGIDNSVVTYGKNARDLSFIFLVLSILFGLYILTLCSQLNKAYSSIEMWNLVSPFRWCYKLQKWED